MLLKSEWHLACRRPWEYRNPSRSLAGNHPVPRPQGGRDTRILMELIGDGTSDRVLGRHIIGIAAEITQGVAIAVRLKATNVDFNITIVLHPTAAKGLVMMRTPTARLVREAGN